MLLIKLVKKTILLPEHARLKLFSVLEFKIKHVIIWIMLKVVPLHGKIVPRHYMNKGKAFPSVPLNNVIFPFYH